MRFAPAQEGEYREEVEEESAPKTEEEEFEDIIDGRKESDPEIFYFDDLPTGGRSKPDENLTKTIKKVNELYNQRRIDETDIDDPFPKLLTGAAANPDPKHRAAVLDLLTAKEKENIEAEEGKDRGSEEEQGGGLTQGQVLSERKGSSRAQVFSQAFQRSQTTNKDEILGIDSEPFERSEESDKSRKTDTTEGTERSEVSDKSQKTDTTEGTEISEKPTDFSQELEALKEHLEEVKGPVASKLSNTLDNTEQLENLERSDLEQTDDLEQAGHSKGPHNSNLSEDSYKEVNIVPSRLKTQRNLHTNKEPRRSDSSATHDIKRNKRDILYAEEFSQAEKAKRVQKNLAIYRNLLITENRNMAREEDDLEEKQVVSLGKSKFTSRPIRQKSKRIHFPPEEPFSSNIEASVRQSVMSRQEVEQDWDRISNIERSVLDSKFDEKEMEEISRKEKLAEKLREKALRAIEETEAIKGDKFEPLDVEDEREEARAELKALLDSKRASFEERVRYKEEGDDSHRPRMTAFMSEVAKQKIAESLGADKVGSLAKQKKGLHDLNFGRADKRVASINEGVTNEGVTDDRLTSNRKNLPLSDDGITSIDSTDISKSTDLSGGCLDTEIQPEITYISVRDPSQDDDIFMPDKVAPTNSLVDNEYFPNQIDPEEFERELKNSEKKVEQIAKTKQGDQVEQIESEDENQSIQGKEAKVEQLSKILQTSKYHQMNDEKTNKSTLEMSESPIQNISTSQANSNPDKPRKALLSAEIDFSRFCNPFEGNFSMYASI